MASVSWIGNRGAQRAELFLRLIWISTWVGLSAQAATPKLRLVTPLFGPPGAIVTLHGESFDPGGATTVKLDGQPANIRSATATALEFEIPQQAASGLVELVTGGQTVRYPVRFQVTRQIAGRFAPPAGLAAGSYDIAGYGSFTSPNNADGGFTIETPADASFIVWAFQNRSQPAFAAVLTPSMSTVTIDAASTARALVFSSPGVHTRDPSAADARLARLNSLPQTAEMAALLDGIVSQGRDYLGDNRLETIWSELTTAMLAPLQRGRGQRGGGPVRPKDLFLKDLNPDYSGDIPVTPVSLKSSLVPEPNDEEGRARFALDGEDPVNNLDWLVELFEVDPGAYPGGRADLEQLTHGDRPRRFSLQPIATGVVRTKLESEMADLPAVAAKKLMEITIGTVFGEEAEEPLATDQFVLESRPPGVYVSHAYSGNLYYGTPPFLSLKSQADLIGQLGGTSRWVQAFAANLVVAALDVISVVLPIDAFMEDPKAIHNILHTVFIDVAKAAAIYQRTGQWNIEVAYELLKTAAESIVKGVIGVISEAIEKSGVEPGVIARKLGQLRRIATIAAKAIAGFVNIFAKISSIEQAGERASGLLLPSSLALERSIMVIGQPFNPRITSFFPQSGRGGEVLTIQGANFSSDIADLSVSLRTFPSTADPSAFTKRVELEVLAATPTSIAARLPANLFTEFPNGRAFVVVERDGPSFFASSAVLAPPYHEFLVLSPPTIASVFPNPVLRGGMLELRGLGFDNETVREYEVLIDGAPVAIGLTSNLDGTRMAITLPITVEPGAHQIAILLRGTTTASFPFTVAKPAYTTPRGEPPGWSILVTRADSSNAADGQVSVLEAFLIIRGQLGRGIEQHPECETLLPTDPNYCPPQPRETDFVGGDEPNRILGPVDTITFPGGLVFSGQFPELSSGDRYLFGNSNSPFVIDGTTAGSVAGMVLDGTTEIHLSGRLVIQNFSGHGLHLKNGANGNYLEGITIRDCDGTGLLLEDSATRNELHHVGVANAGQHGIHLTGAGVSLNKISSVKGNVTPFMVLYDAITDCGGNGIRVDGDASFNTIIPGTIRNCGGAGIHVVDATHNFFGRETEELRRHFDLVNNDGPGAYIGPGAVGNIFRYLNPIGNEGDGVLLEGPHCSNNVVDRTFAGVNLYEGGPSFTIANEGSGIRITGGAQFNLIGARRQTLGEHGSICGNRDDGVLLEGADTALNTVNAQVIGVLDAYIGAQGLRFSGNGRSGIALRGGARANIIGAANGELANLLVASAEAGIEITGEDTDNNLIFGNQIGSFLNYWVMASDSPNRNRIGIWIHEGPRNNTIGLPGGRLLVPRFPGDTAPSPFQSWNAINTCREAGVLIENAGGTLTVDGTISGENIIQANHIGELDNGQLAPSGEGAGIKLGIEARANIIGGRTPELGNRMRGWFRAGVWIDQNFLDSSELRNRFENNYIDGPGTGISFRFTDYLTATPSGGVGVLITNSSGHQIGESQLTKNTLHLNRLGIYIADSTNIAVRGCVVTDSYNAGVVVRGGSANSIGGDLPDQGNVIHVFGFRNEPNWAGLTLSNTTGNRVRGNEIGNFTAARGSTGLFLSNAGNNEIGGPREIHGNVIISNFSHGVLINGLASTGNELFNNFVGRDRNGNSLANGGDGVRLENDAHDNFVGGLADDSTAVGGAVLSSSVPAGNTIADNLQAGVRVVGGNTVGNQILYNTITNNGSRGILNENGGNNLQPSPLLLAFDGTALSGRVDDLAVTPPGSIVQVFTDPDAADPEGDAPLGEATVQSNGTWRAVVVGAMLHPSISATATHAINGSTSQFGTGIPINTLLEFEVERTDSALLGSIPAGAANASVLRLSLSAVNADVRVRSIAFQAAGSLPDATAVTAMRLYHDGDEDGMISAADYLLAGPLSFGTDNGTIAFSIPDVIVEGNTTKKWIVSSQLAGNAPADSTFKLILVNADAVMAEYTNPIGLEAVPQGSFAIESAEFTVTDAPAGQTFAAWQATVFSAPQLADPKISGIFADPDRDGLINLLEYAFNLNPLLSDQYILPIADRGVPHPVLTRAFDPASQSEQSFFELTFVRRQEPVDLTYRVEYSPDLQNWSDALVPPAALTISARQDVGLAATLERVTYRGTLPVTSPAVRSVRVRVQQKP